MMVVVETSGSETTLFVKQGLTFDMVVTCFLMSCVGCTKDHEYVTNHVPFHYNWHV